MIEGRATVRYVRTSAQKAKLVLDLIRGRDVNTALATLRFARKGVARDVEKAVRSAVANAQQKEGASGDVDRLYVGACHADQGPSLKRIRAAPMGRAFRILKRTAHLTVTVRERPETATVVPETPRPASDADATTPTPKRRAASARTRTRKRAGAAKSAAGARKRTPKAKSARKAARKKTAAKKAKKSD